MEMFRVVNTNEIETSSFQLKSSQLKNYIVSTRSWVVSFLSPFTVFLHLPGWKFSIHFPTLRINFSFYTSSFSFCYIVCCFCSLMHFIKPLFALENTSNLLTLERSEGLEIFWIISWNFYKEKIERVKFLFDTKYNIWI
jgi:hypothetical protein